MTTKKSKSGTAVAKKQNKTEHHSINFSPSSMLSLKMKKKLCTAFSLQNYIFYFLSFSGEFDNEKETECSKRLFKKEVILGLFDKYQPSGFVAKLIPM